MLSSKDSGGAGSDLLILVLLFAIGPFTAFIPLIIWGVWVVFCRKSVRENLAELVKQGKQGQSQQIQTVTVIDPEQSRIDELEGQIRIKELEAKLATLSAGND